MILAFKMSNSSSEDDSSVEVFEGSSDDSEKISTKLFRFLEVTSECRTSGTLAMTTFSSNSGIQNGTRHY
jgi:hypothetical protein